MARVYPLEGDPDWVVKITSDPTDAALMAEAQFAGPLRDTPGIPKVASVFDLGPSPVRPDKFPGHVYAVVVERMQPLSHADKLKVRALSNQYERGWYAYPETVAELLKKAAPGSVEEAWLRGVAFVQAMGFRPTDLHANNIMQRKDGSFAFSDFGLSGVEGRIGSRDIPALGDFAPKKKAKRPRTKAKEKRKTDDLYEELVAAGFDAPAGEQTRPMTKVRRNPTTLAEKAASVQTRYDNALARMAAKPALREDEDYVEFVADLKRQLDTLNALLRVQAEREERALLDDTDARRHAEAFIRILGEVGGPKQLRVWQKKGVGTRIYFPGELGYVTVGRDGSVWSMGPGGQTLAVTALYPAWRRAYNQANRLHAQAREEAFALAHPEED
jgi:hypothetical protein